MMAPLAMMVLPPRMIFCGPAIVALRDTLLPVSCVSADEEGRGRNIGETSSGSNEENGVNTNCLDVLCLGVVYRSLHCLTLVALRHAQGGVDWPISYEGSWEMVDVEDEPTAGA